MTQISFCSTNYNTSDVTRESLESVLGHAQGIEHEVVIVDNFSDDGSYEALKSFAPSVPLILEQHRCTRGRGRQIAFARSRGEYVVTFDLDTVYNEDWGRLLRWVLDTRIPFGLSAQFSQFYPREALAQVGGWRDLQYWEDVDLWARLAAIGRYRTYPVICGENRKRVPGRTPVAKALRLYARARDKIALADWIPFRLYFQGYLALLRSSQRSRTAYPLGVLLPAYVAGRRKRGRLYPEGKGPSVLADPRLFLDVRLVPSERLVPLTTEYDTLAGCEGALERGDLGFLPGTYD